MHPDHPISLPTSPRLRIYFDDLRAGHAYLELFGPGDCDAGDLYGLYPERFDGGEEILLDVAELRHDRERLARVRSDDDQQLVWAERPLNASQVDRLRAFLQEETEAHRIYFVAGANCVEFIQRAYRVALGSEDANFMDLFDRGELLGVSWVGPYAVARYPG